MINRINVQGKLFEAVLLDLEEGKSSLVLVDKEKDETTIIYMDTAQVTVRGLPKKGGDEYVQPNKTVILSTRMALPQT